MSWWRLDLSDYGLSLGRYRLRARFKTEVEFELCDLLLRRSFVLEEFLLQEVFALEQVLGFALVLGDQ